MIKRGFKRLRVEPDFRSEHLFCTDSLYNHVLVLNDMPWITKCSFIVHKSIDYLDLSLHENSYLTAEKCMDARWFFYSDKHPLYNKFVNTQEKFRKAMIPDRRLLYIFHLDPPKDREGSLKVVSDLEYLTMDSRSIFCDTIYVTGHDYEESIRKFVQLYFLRRNIETQRMRGLLRLMKLALSSKVPLRDEERNKIFTVMSRKCTDTDAAREFISMHNFTQWFLSYYKTKDLDFIVRHGRQTTYVLEINNCVYDVINWLIAFSNFRENVEILLRYQDQPSITDFDYKLIVESCVKQSYVGTYVTTMQLQAPIQQRCMSKRRHFLLLQVLKVFFDLNRNVDKQCLRILWRALPDSFFTSDDLMFTYEKIPHPMLVSLHAFYKGIVDEDISDSKPRSLQHYGRVAVRRLLCHNKMLPEGIEQLGLGQALQAYLRLEK